MNSGGGDQSVAIALSTNSATVASGGTQQFQATVTGSSNTSVQWQVNGINGGNAQVGTISSSGTYQAPVTSSDMTVTVTAIPAADGSKSASATVTISASGQPAVTISVSPSTAAIASGVTQQFTATVTGSTNTAVQWQVNGVGGGNSQVGTISATGLYTAPLVTSPITVTVTAISTADSTKSASAMVTVNPASSTITVSLTSGSSLMAINSSQQFTATVTGTTNTAVSWSVDGVAGGDVSVGTISSTGVYTAPSTAGTHTVMATSAASASASASATVSIMSLTLSPQNAVVAASGTQQFTATVEGTTNTAVNWSVDSIAGGNSTTGTVSSTGLYTAPATTGSHTLTAVSSALPSYSARTTIIVSSGGNTQGLSAIQHIIFVSEENRSFDTYFGKLNEYRVSQGLPSDVDGLPDDCSSSNSDWTVPCSAMNKSPNASGYPTTPVYAFHLKTTCIENTSADWIASHWDFNALNPNSDTPLMDGYVISAASSALSTGTSDTAGIRAMGFYTAQDLEYPYWLATQFATSDRWFSPEAARTQPNRYYMVGATSGGQAYPSGIAINQKTIFDLLTQAGISWKIYVPSGGNVSATAFSQFKANGNVVPYSQFIIDAQSGTLPAVAYIEKPDNDQHPGINVDIEDGVQEVENLVNAVMYGPEWSSSVMIVTFDESGGLYDHVPPPTNVPNPDGIKPLDLCTGPGDPDCAVAAISHKAPPYDAPGDFTRTGFRVPLMVISPFAKAHYVSHTVTDYTSWMKLVETRFGLSNLNARDAWASDMAEYFDFQNVPWATPPAPSSVPPVINTKGGQCYDGLP